MVSSLCDLYLLFARMLSAGTFDTYFSYHKAILSYIDCCNCLLDVVLVLKCVISVDSCTSILNFIVS